MTQASRSNENRTSSRHALLASVKVREVMTPLPLTIDEDIDLATARRLLKEHNIRHLPVVHGGKLTGILSERDVRLVALNADIPKIAVAEVMSSHPETVSEETLVIEAVAKMAKKKYGSLVVTDESGKISGIFTSHDALGLLLRERRQMVPAPTAWLEDDAEIGDESDCLG